jgi:hypothetical protein
MTLALPSGGFQLAVAFRVDLLLSPTSTSFGVMSVLSKNSIRFCCSATWRWGRSSDWKKVAPFSKNSFCQR